jgi:hypothetical protein
MKELFLLIFITKNFWQGFFNIKASSSKILQETENINILIEFTRPYISKILSKKDAKTVKNKHLSLFSYFILKYQEYRCCPNPK